MDKCCSFLAQTVGHRSAPVMQFLGKICVYNGNTAHVTAQGGLAQMQPRFQGR